LLGYDDERCYIAYVKPQFTSINFHEVVMNSIYDTFLLENIQKYGTDEEVVENYRRFHGKQCITCVFSLDFDQPYYLNWFVDGKDLIQEHQELIRFTLCEYLKEKYTPENNSVYYFYKYWRIHCPLTEQKPSDFVRFLKEKYNEMKERYERNTGFGKRYFPVYVEEFFTYLQRTIDACPDRKQKRAILESYENRDVFLKEIGELMESSLRRYLRLRLAESGSEDSEGSEGSEGSESNEE